MIDGNINEDDYIDEEQEQKQDEIDLENYGEEPITEQVADIENIINELSDEKIVEELEQVIEETEQIP